jgi:hypothetical protein
MRLIPVYVYHRSGAGISVGCAYWIGILPDANSGAVVTYRSSPLRNPHGLPWNT